MGPVVRWLDALKFAIRIGAVFIRPVRLLTVHSVWLTEQSPARGNTGTCMKIVFARDPPLKCLPKRHCADTPPNGTPTGTGTSYIVMLIVGLQLTAVRLTMFHSECFTLVVSFRMFHFEYSINKSAACTRRRTMRPHNVGGNEVRLTTLGQTLSLRSAFDREFAIGGRVHDSPGNAKFRPAARPRRLNDCFRNAG